MNKEQGSTLAGNVTSSTMTRNSLKMLLFKAICKRFTATLTYAGWDFLEPRIIWMKKVRQNWNHFWHVTISSAFHTNRNTEYQMHFCRLQRFPTAPLDTTSVSNTLGKTSQGLGLNQDFSMLFAWDEEGYASLPGRAANALQTPWTHVDLES